VCISRAGFRADTFSRRPTTRSPHWLDRVPPLPPNSKSKSLAPAGGGLPALPSESLRVSAERVAGHAAAGRGHRALEGLDPGPGRRRPAVGGGGPGLQGRAAAKAAAARPSVSYPSHIRGANAARRVRAGGVMGVQAGRDAR
jgi:hypothetical protein